jgi:hypothetical protein
MWHLQPNPKAFVNDRVAGRTVLPPDNETAD